MKVIIRGGASNIIIEADLFVFCKIRRLVNKGREAVTV